MAKIAISYDPDVMEIRRGGGVLTAVGVFFLLLVLTFVGITLSSMQDTDSMIVASIFFGIMLIGDLALILGRAGIVIDRRQKLLTTWWGLLVPWSKTQYELTGFSCITITKEIRRSKNSTYTVYVVRLKNQESKDIHIEENQDYLTSRRSAETVAKFMNLPLSDNSSGSEVIRKPEELDESLRNRLRRTGQIKPMPEDLPETKIQHRIEGDTLILRLPKHGFGIWVGCIVAIGIIISGIFSVIITVILAEFAKDPNFLLFLLIAGVIALLPLGFCLFAAYYHYTMREEVHISPQRLMLKKSWKFGKRSEEIQMDELEELELATVNQYQAKGRMPVGTGANFNQVSLFNPGIVARSDYKVMNFGQSLNRKEVEWVMAVIENAITR